MQEEMLGGEADPVFYTTITDNGEPTSPGEAIFPILKQSLTNTDFRLIGTGFFIGIYGVFMTAKHVLMDVLDSTGQQRESIGIVHFLPNNKFLLRNITKCYTFENSDVGVGIVAQATHNVTKSPLTNKILKLREKEPEIGDIVFTYAYPDTQIENNPPRHTFNFQPRYYEGRLVKYYPGGRDRCFLSNPCWQTSITIHGGASGGPVLGETGCVTGINSTGFSGQPDVSFISGIRHALELKVPGIIIPPETTPREYTIRELGELGHLHIEFDN